MVSHHYLQDHETIITEHLWWSHLLVLNCGCLCSRADSLICRTIMVKLVVWAIACLIQLTSHTWPLSLQLVCNRDKYSMIKATLQRGNNNHLQSLVQNLMISSVLCELSDACTCIHIGIKNVTCSHQWAPSVEVFYSQLKITLRHVQVLFVNIHSCIYSACTVYGVLSMCQLVTS